MRSLPPTHPLCTHIPGIRHHDGQQGKMGEEDAPLNSHGSERKLGQSSPRKATKPIRVHQTEQEPGSRGHSPSRSCRILCNPSRFASAHLGVAWGISGAGPPSAGFACTTKRGKWKELSFMSSNWDTSLRPQTAASFPSPAILPPTPGSPPGSTPGLPRNY